MWKTETYFYSFPLLKLKTMKPIFISIAVSFLLAFVFVWLANKAVNFKHKKPRKPIKT